MTATLTPTEQRSTEELPKEDTMTSTVTTPEQRSTEQPPAYYMYPAGPGAWAPQPAPKPGRGLAIAGLVLGIVGIGFGLIPLTFWMALVLGVLGLIFGIVGRRYGMGKAAAILSTAAVGLGIWGAVILNSAVHDLNNDLNNVNTGAAAAVQMVDT